MASAGQSLLQLQRLTATARKEGCSSDNDSGNDGEGVNGSYASVNELERRLAGLEEEMLRGQNLREQARELHHRARRRRQRQERGDQEHWRSVNVSVEESRDASCDTANAAADARTTVATSRLLSSHPPPRDTQVRLDGGHVGETRTPRGVCGASDLLDPGAHLLVDITSGSARLGGVKESDYVGSAFGMLCSGGSCAPSYSFAQAYAGEERQRLLFIVDQLSHILREERRQKEALLLHVVPPMLREIGVLQRKLGQQQSEIDSLKQEMGLQAVPASSGNERKTDSSDVGEEGDPVLSLLEYCEEQLFRLGV